MITAANKDIADGINTTSFQSNSITPVANRLYLATVFSRQATGTPATPTMSGCGLTWVQVRTYNPGGSNRRITLFRALGAAPSTGQLTVDFGGVEQSHATINVDEFIGINTGGTNGSAAVVQSGENTASSNTVTVTLSAFGSSANATYGTFQIRTAATATPGTGFTELTDHNNGGVIISSTEFRADNDTTVDITFSVSNAVEGFGVELLSATGISPSSSLSPSSSASASGSPSASLSPSASRSPSASSSSSGSPSPSPSPSIPLTMMGIGS